MRITEALAAAIFLYLCLSSASAEGSVQPVGFVEPKDVVFEAEVDGTEQRYVLLLPLGFDAKESHDLVVALHGHGSDRWQFVRADLAETRAARDVAARHDMIYVSPDYRATTSWMGPKAEADVVQIIRDLKAEYSIRRVFIVGASMGGSSGLTFAALRPDLVDGVCSQNPTANHLEYENFQDAIAETFGGTKAQIPREYKKRSAEYWPENLTMPVAITVGGKDESVPPGSAIRLAGVLKAIGRKVLLINREETGHTTSYEDTITAFEFVISEATDRRGKPPGFPREPK